MWKVITKHRSFLIFVVSLAFNLLSSMYFGRGTTLGFNPSPNSLTEWICDSLCLVGWVLSLYLACFDWLTQFASSLKLTDRNQTKLLLAQQQAQQQTLLIQQQSLLIKQQEDLLNTQHRLVSRLTKTNPN